MKIIGRMLESFAILPSVGINWYTYRNKKHFYITVQWLFWYVTSLKKFKWE